MDVSLEYKGKPLFNKKSERIILEKYFQMSHQRLIEDNTFYNYSATISVRDVDLFQRAYKAEMQKFAREKKIVGYKIPAPEISVQYRVARVFLDFSRSGPVMSLGGESWARQQILHPITEYDRKLSFVKAKSILKKFERS
jgi:hypothetical protein